MGRFVIGMETSGAVRDAVRALGHDCLSVDLLPHQHGGPHHEGDLFAFLDRDSAFDGGVFHPECTYHTLSAAWAFGPGPYHQRTQPGTLTGEARKAARAKAEADVERIKALPFPKIIENPRGTLSTRTSLGPAHQVVQPYEFGSDASKATCFWFFDAEGRPIPHLRLPVDPAARVPGRWVTMPDGRRVERWANQSDGGQNRLTPGPDRWKVRSDTYPGIAAALAHAITRHHDRPQWSLVA
jgi:hypothetical protein